jgi:hypothetical protein
MTQGDRMSEEQYRRFVAGDYDPRTPRDCGWLHIIVAASAFGLFMVLATVVAFAGPCLAPGLLPEFADAAARQFAGGGQPRRYFISPPRSVAGGEAFDVLFLGEDAGNIYLFEKGCLATIVEAVPAAILIGRMPPAEAAIFRAALAGEGGGA